MSFLELTKAFGDSRIIDIRNVITYFNGLDRRRLYEWQKKGYLLKVSNNFYVLTGKPVEGQVLKSIANRIYNPSYIGLQSALAYYNFIPEAVFQTVSVTTQRNKILCSKLGDFSYRSIKPQFFFGFKVVDNQNESFFISDPEKTLLDLFYFTPDIDKKDALIDLRLNIEAIRTIINVEKLKDYLRIFSSPKMTKAAGFLLEMAHVEL